MTLSDKEVVAQSEVDAFMENFKKVADYESQT